MLLVFLVVLDLPPLVILHLQYCFILLCGSGLQCFLPSLPSSIQSLLDHGKTDGRPYVLFHLHYITSCCVAAQVLYLLSYLFLYVKTLYAYGWESKNIFHSLFFVLPANSVSFSSWSFEVRLFNLFCAPDQGTYHNSWPRPQEWDNCRLLIKPPGHAEVCYPVRFSVMLPDSSSHKMHSSQILIVCFGLACLFVDVGGLLCRLIPIAIPCQGRWKTVCNHKVDHWLKIQIYYTDWLRYQSKY